MNEHFESKRYKLGDKVVFYLDGMDFEGQIVDAAPLYYVVRSKSGIHHRIRENRLRLVEGTTPPLSQFEQKYHRLPVKHGQGEFDYDPALASLHQEIMAFNQQNVIDLIIDQGLAKGAE